MEILDTLIKPEMTKEEQVRKLYNFVSGEIKYSFVPFYNSAYIPKDPTNTVSSLIGDCKDVATLMLTLLKELNIESYYTLVKTNQMDHLENIPSSNFDHVIVMYIIDGDTNYIDLTTDYFPMEVLPEMDCGANALVIKDGVTEDFYLPKMHLTPEKNMLHVKMTVNMKDDRSVEAKMDINYKGVIAGMMRETLTKTPVNQQDDFLADRISDNIFNDLELTDYKFERLQNIESDLESRISFKANNFLDRVSNLYIFQMPYMVDIPATSVVSNKIRTNRIHLGQILETTPSKQEITITFPKGYQLTELPENISITHAYGNYSVKFSRIPGGMKVVKEQVFHKDIFEVEEFEDFKNFYRRLMDADRMKVAIMRASNR
jgi:ribosome-associated toxin RatA of RatAB toxin-antitoxin module